MTARAQRIAAVAVISLLLASPSHAQIPDPVQAGLLQRIVNVLQAIQRFRMEQLEGLQLQIFNRQRGHAFPSLLFEPIRLRISNVLDIRRELQRLTCNWPMSTRTGRLGDLLRRPLFMCRDGFHGVFGSHEHFWDAPIHEVNDYVATMTSNMISERSERTHMTWVRAHADLFDGHAVMRRSPGEANRAEAAALAFANQVAVGNSQIVTQDLLVRQMARDLERFDQKKAADLSHYTYRGLTTLAGFDGRTPPPDPADRMGR